jgi:hypothetical protein
MLFKHFYFILSLILYLLTRIDTRIHYQNNLETIEPSNLNETLHQTYRECLIHSRQYLFEYLSSDENLNSPHSIGGIYTMPLLSVDDFDHLRWSFIPANTQYRFYIRSVKHPTHFLCATASHKYLFNMRRVVKIINLNEYQNFFNNSLMNLKNCQWRFDQVKARNSKNNTYIIWNVIFEEPLYTATSLLKEDTFKRNVFLWYQSPSKSNKFKWFIDCFNGLYLSI